MDFDSQLVVMALLIGPIFIITGFLFYLFPPKKINSLYGYRTASSMKSQSRWDFSQKISAKYMMILGFSYSVVLFLLSKFSLSEIEQVGAGMGLLILKVVLLIVVVERKLKRNFQDKK